MSLKKAMRNARKACNYEIGKPPRVHVAQNFRVDHFATPEETVTRLPDTTIIDMMEVSDGHEA